MNRPVSRDALIKRVRRALRRWNWQLEIRRDQEGEQDDGRYCLVDGHGNIKDRSSSLESLARDLRVLRDGKVVGDDHQGGEALDYPTGLQILLQSPASRAET